ncbi:MAG: DUF1926 domain-containing protein [Deltaproteobacteria bacterium]|nr:DUF1926 domain-containing protein [Deltaproteobacteria bacterium]
MDSLALVLGVRFAVPPTADRAGIASAWDRAFGPTIQALENAPGVPVALQVSGLLLEALESTRPDALATLRRVAGRPGVDLLCGGWYDPPLGAVPERDALGQLRLSARRLKALLGNPPVAAWLPAWDPSLPHVLGRAGLSAALVDVATFLQAGLGEAAVGPWRVAVREGETLAVVPDRGRVDRVLPEQSPEVLVRSLRRRAEEGTGAVTWMIDARELGIRSGSDVQAWGPDPWLPRLLERLAGEHHWLTAIGIETLLDHFRAAGRIALPSALDPRLSALLPTGDDRFSDEPPLAQPWDAFLVRYDESYRLFQRMLEASRDVYRLSTAIRDGKLPRDRATPALERAVFALYRSQSTAFYQPDPWGGLHRADLRRRCRSLVLRALSEASRALETPGPDRLERRDQDGDGHEEIEFRSPDLRLVVAPAMGGAVQECELLGLFMDLFESLTRRVEACHALLEQDPVLPALLPPGTPCEPSAPEPVEPSVAADDETVEPEDTSNDRKGVRPLLDRGPRLALVDHFLGPQATPANVRIGRYPEEGDFVGACYDVLLAESTATGGPILRLARDGAVHRNGGAHLVRVVKTLHLLPDGRGFEVTWDVANRLRDPLSTCFSTELTLAMDPRENPAVRLEVDGQPAGASADPEAVAARIEWADERARLKVRIGVEPAARVWHFPVETIGPALQEPGGWSVFPQGTCLFLSWPLTLWGEERRTFTVTLHAEVTPVAEAR